MKLFVRSSLFLLAAATALGIAPVQADNKGATTAALKKASFGPGQGTQPAATIAGPNDTFVFTAPPRENADTAQQIFGPVAEYLSKATGKKFEYRHPGTWGVYRTEMLKGSYDLVFDGPHFNSYRAERLNHNVIVKVPDKYEFAVIVKDDKYKSPQQLAGRQVCAHAPPNLGTLILLSQFDNPSRQPLIKSTDGWDNIYKGVAAGQCVAGILPVGNLKKLDTAGQMKVVYKTQTLPNQAFSASSRISPEDQAKIVQALLAPEGNAATARLREAYKVNNGFAAASNAEYAGIAEYLKTEWGYY